MRDEPRERRVGRDAPANPSAAPGQLELVRAFVNTLDIEAATDVLATPGDARRWLAERGVRVRRLGETEHRSLVEVREAIRDAVRAGGDAEEGEAPARLESLAAKHPLTVRLTGSGAVPLAPVESGVGGFIGGIFAIVATSLVDGSWFRLKSCPNDRCRWLFYDHSRNRSRTWCSMDLCGSRAKMRTYRARRRAAVS